MTDASSYPLSLWERVGARVTWRHDRSMNCVICNHGRTHAGTKTVTLEKGTMTLVVKDVPAQICDNCGEGYVDETVTSRLLKQAAEAAAAGVEVDVRSYAA